MSFMTITTATVPSEISSHQGWNVMLSTDKSGYYTSHQIELYNALLIVHRTPEQVLRYISGLSTLRHRPNSLIVGEAKFILFD